MIWHNSAMSRVGPLCLAVLLAACRFDGAEGTPDMVVPPDGVPDDADGPDAPPDMEMTSCRAVEIAAGQEHTCARMEDGGLYCWGRNNDGQVGAPTPSTCGGSPCSTTAVRVSALPEAATTLGLGAIHSCAGSATSTYCWGSNLFGAFGDGTAGPIAGSAAPRMIAQRGRSLAIAGGLYHTCSIDDSGNVLCSGGNQQGEVGTGNLNPQPTATMVYTGASGIAAGDFANCAISPSFASCWGNDFPTPSVDPRISGAIQTALGRKHICWLKNNAVQCFGQNNGGQLGTGSTNPTGIPVTFGIPGAVELVARGDHTCVRTTANTVHCAGTGYGATPVAVNVPGTVMQLAAGRDHDCAVTAAGEVYCWGAQEFGQLGNGVSAVAREPLPQLAQICP